MGEPPLLVNVNNIFIDLAVKLYFVTYLNAKYLIWIDLPIRNVHLLINDPEVLEISYNLSGLSR